ncbi:MAG: histidine kinase dimerization/phosphoacceptor domain -containing protein [Crocinitomicaceae bacterium]
MKKLGFISFLLTLCVFSFGQMTEDEKVKEFSRLYDVTLQYQTTVLDSAHYFLDSCIDHAKKIKSDYYLGKALQLKARGEFYEGEIDSSMYFGQKSIDILLNYKDSIEYFIAEYNQGNLFLYNEDNIQALVQFKKVSNIIDQNFEMYVQIDRNKVILNRAYCYTSIGMVLLSLEDYNGALIHFNKSLKSTERLNSWECEVLRSVILSNLGSTYYYLGDYQMAESYAVASMEQKKKLGQEGSIGYSFQVLADAAYGRGKYKLSLSYLEQSDKKFEILDNREEMFRNNFSRAKCYKAQNRLDKALTTLLELESSYLSHFGKKEQSNFYELLAEVYQAKNDFKLANDYFRITLKLRKTLDLKNDKTIVREFITFFESEEVQLNNKIQNLKNVQEKEKLQLQIDSENEKKVWIYTLFLVSTLCLVLVIMVISNAYRRNKKMNKELSDSIEENKVLFKEVHHRVKNNFQIISSLLNLQHGIEENERGKKVLTDAQGRIQSMSLVHEMLYRKSEVKRIDFKSYASGLVDSIIKSFTNETVVIDFKVESENESFDLEVAVPLGLILNEAITNAVKYAFTDLQTGLIEIHLKHISADNYSLVIKDNGIGIPEDFINGSKETLGIELINILSEQLGGSVSFKNNSGTEIVIYFKG